MQAEHWKVVREIGVASAVLLKNNNNTLPLKKPRSIVLVGNDAGPALRGPNGFVDRAGDDGVLAVGWGSGTTRFPYLISPLEAIQARGRQDRSSVSWWLDDFDTAGASAAVRNQDVAVSYLDHNSFPYRPDRSCIQIVFVNADSGEGYITIDGNEGDRKNLTLWHNGENLITAVANNNKNTIVVAHSVGPVIVESWIDHPNVTAVR